MIQLASARTPAGFEPVPDVEAFLSGAQVHEILSSEEEVVVLGQPAEEDASHNCDAMGCGRQHVLCRLRRKDRSA